MPKPPKPRPSVFRPILAPVLLLAGALTGCGILVDRYDSSNPYFSAEFRNETERVAVISQAAEYCAIFDRAARATKTVIVDGEPVSVFACR